MNAPYERNDLNAPNDDRLTALTQPRIDSLTPEHSPFELVATRSLKSKGYL
jgi:hypothetical protein